MLLQQIARTDADKVFIVVQNDSTTTYAGNNLCCFDFLATNVSFGNAISNPVTSNLALFAGVIDADIVASAFGLCQVYGFRASIAANVGAVSQSTAGLIMGPLNANVSAQSTGRTFALGPIVLFDNDLSATGFFRGLIRAL